MVCLLQAFKPFKVGDHTEVYHSGEYDFPYRYLTPNSSSKKSFGPFFSIYLVEKNTDVRKCSVLEDIICIDKK